MYEKGLKFKNWSQEKVLYKYMTDYNANTFFTKGEMRIGTLYEFRDEELHGKNRGDKNEGTKAIYEDVDVFLEDSQKANTLSPSIQDKIKLGNSKNITISNTRVEDRIISPDFYIYCFSSKFDRRLYEAFNTDVCIIIKSPGKFIRSISISLRNYATFKYLSPIVYKSRNQKYGSHDKYHPSILKEEIYKPQNEVRAIWEPKISTQIEPQMINLDIKYINRYCELHNKK